MLPAGKGGEFCHPSIGLGMIGVLVGVLMLLSGSALLSFGQLSWFW